MWSLALVALLSASVVSAVPVNVIEEPIPSNITNLYPPYNYTGPYANYKPHPSGIPMAVNTTKKPWETKPNTNKVDANRLFTEASCSPLTPTNPSTFWYSQITHDGTSPFIPDGANWKVFRNVVSDYGADNTGSKDSQSAFQNAINNGAPTSFSRNTNSLGTTGQPAVIYIPGGTYTLNSPLQLYVGTVLMGDPLNPPTIKAGSGWDFSKGSTMIFGKDPNQGSTTNFYIAIKNIKLDSTSISASTTFNIMDWSVSQATQLSNLVFNMPNFSTGHTGIVMPEGGSGTFMGDLVFNGGAVGINMSNQQYSIKSCTFNAQTTGILVSHSFDLLVIDSTFENNGIGIDMTPAGSMTVGSVALVDSTANSVGTVVATLAESTGDHSLVIENFTKGSGVTNVVTASGKSVLSQSVTDTWVYGNAYVPNGPATGQHQTGTTYSTPRSASLLSGGKYVALKPPTYQEYDVSQFVNVKQVSGLPVAGDGVTDDTANLNAIIAQNAGCKILFFPQGTYLATNTLFFPAGSRVVGEAWSAISANGQNFFNPSAPVPMVKVGNAGDKGVAQFVDMLFTVADVLQGCTLVEVNIAGNSPGDVGFWNSHFRVGGAAGSKVQTNCGGSPASCPAAFMLMHLTSTSSAYVENNWGWTADHDLDGGHGQTISTGRGMLVEATSATWLHGVAYEHNTLYQFNFNNAQNVFVGMQQSETPYWQGPGSPSLAPAPWATVSSIGDPIFSNCDSDDALCRMAWYNRISGSSNLFLYSSGFWTFFNHNGDCTGDSDGTSFCQLNAAEILSTTDLYWFNLNTKDNLNMVTNNGQVLVTENNNPGSWGGCVAAMLADS